MPKQSVENTAAFQGVEFMSNPLIFAYNRENQKAENGMFAHMHLEGFSEIHDFNANQILDNPSFFEGGLVKVQGCEIWIEISNHSKFGVK